MPNVSMWARALRVMPQVDKEEWDALDLVSRWLIATRSAVLVMTFVSAAFAGLLALKVGAFDLGKWLLVTLGLLLAHATNNLVNDLTDHWKGVDKDNYFRTQYGAQPVESGLMTTRQSLQYIAFTGLTALGIGVWLVALGGQGVLWLLGAGAFFVLLYTWPLKYIGLGEPAVLAVWGPLMVGGGYYVITGEWSTPVAWASVAYALGPTAVLFGKHIDKLTEDKAKGIHTLPVILGEAASRWFVVGMLVAQLGVVVYLVATGYFHPVMLLALAAAPSLKRVLEVYSKPRPTEPPADLPKGVWPLYLVATAFWYNRRFGGLFLLALVADVAISRF
ncbi:MAG: prenyltransferase [Deltaproteobacteria bacterium]|nr:prenyltransferase [Deltaproteobacteria bacterium]MBW2394210.1 prenyltransferase [Deltaproteobacteria bacterium]